MGRYCSKEGKNRRKVTFNFEIPLFCHIYFSYYIHIAILFHALRVGARAQCVRIYACMRAPSNSDVVFLLSQVSHQGQKAKPKQPKFWRRREYKIALFQILSTKFWELE